MDFKKLFTQQEPVLKKSYIFFTISGVTILLVLLFHFIMEFSRIHYLDIEKNEQVKTHISFFVQQKIRSLQIEFQYMLLSASTVELHNANRKIISDIDLIKKAVEVIENGGHYEEKIFVNFGQKEQVIQSLDYVAPQKSAISLSAIEMRTNLARIEEMRQNYFDVMERRLNSHNKVYQGNLTLFHKKIAPFFKRLIENSNRLYVESHETYSTAENSLTRQTNLIIFISSLILPALLILAALIAIRILRDIRRLVTERSRALHDLQKANENLETLVENRTFALSQEVEERQDAEKRFAKQAEFLTNVIESLGHPFYVINCDDHSISMANQAAKKLTIDNPDYCYLHSHGPSKSNTAPDSPCPIEEVKKSKSPVIIEHLHRTSSGETKMFEIHGYPIFNVDGQVVQMIEYCLDVTEKHLARKALEEAMNELEEKVKQRTALLKQSEQHFRNLIEGVRDIIAILDKTGCITYISPSVYHVLGYAPEDMVGQSFQKYTNVDIKSAQKFLQKSDSSHEHQIFDRSGTVHIMESTIQEKFDDPLINGFLITSRDVSARKQAESDQKRLHMVVEQNPSSVVITDTNGNIEYVNPEFERVTGYSKEEVLGKNPKILNSGLTAPEIFVDMYETVGKGDVWQGEFINRRRSGELYTENVIVAPIKDDNGKVANFVALKENITELKKAREQAETANAAKSEFLSRMSHELRTPLNAIIGFSDLLLENKQAALVGKQEEQVQHIHSAGRHLMQMIEKILDFSKVDSSNFIINLEPIAPGEIINECVSIAEHLTKKNNITLNIADSLGVLPLIQVDRTRFKQIVVNLISNAIKYNIPNGSVTISASTSEEEVEFTISDTGIGIPFEKQEKLFTPFTRFAEDASNIEGTGIGMTITKQLVEAMAGTIHFTSKEQQGSSFTITFPLHTENGLNTADKTSSLLSKGTFFTVLYIDNDINRIKEVRHLFSMWQEATLVVRKDPHKALKTISLMQPDLVLLCNDFLHSTKGTDLLEKVQANCKDGSLLLTVSGDNPLITSEEKMCLQFPLSIKRIMEAANTLARGNG